MITKTVLFAAGRGTRLGALTANYPKALLEVAGRPIIVHILDGLVRAGITDVAVITGHSAGLLEAEVGTGQQSGLRITYVRQETLDGTARALGLCRDLLDDGQFFWSWGDILVDDSNYVRVLTAARFADAVVAVNEVEDPWAGGAVYIDDSMQVTRIIEKPQPGTSATRWNNAGFGILGPAIWPEIDRLHPSTRGEYELPRAIAAMVDSGIEVRAVPVVGLWFDVGTPEALQSARVAYAGSGGPR